MPREALNRFQQAAAVLVLALACAAAAVAAPAHPAGTPRSASVATTSAARLTAVWQWLTHLWSATPTTAVEDPGLGIDPYGRPAIARDLPDYSAVKGHEGSAVDPDGHH
jgi:hypothetical protein